MHRTHSGRATTTAYDGDGKVISTTDPRGNVTGAHPADYTTRFEYDANGQQITTIDPLGRSTITAYDAAGQVVSVTDPANEKVEYTYDPRTTPLMPIWSISRSTVQRATS